MGEDEKAVKISQIGEQIHWKKTVKGEK